MRNIDKIEFVVLPCDNGGFIVMFDKDTIEPDKDEERPQTATEMFFMGSPTRRTPKARVYAPDVEAVAHVVRTLLMKEGIRKNG